MEFNLIDLDCPDLVRCPSISQSVTREMGYSDWSDSVM